MILPALNCRTARAFRPPELFTIGTEASDWYWEKDQSLGDALVGKESRRRIWRCWWRRGEKARVELKIRPPARRGVRRPQVKRREANNILAVW